MKRIAQLAKLYGHKTEKYAIIIDFPLNWEDVERMKQLPNKKFHKEGVDRFWSCDLTVEAVELLIKWGFWCDEYLHKFLEDAREKHKEEMQLDIADQLYHFQRVGVDFIEQRFGRALIADEMGLGKTVQALAWLRMNPELRPVCIVCPANLKYNWENETNKWLENPNIQILEGMYPYEITGDIVIINYDILYNWVKTLKAYKFEVLITDEAHYYKNNSAKRTEAVKKLAFKIDHIIALTGTPVLSRPIEIYNAINIIEPRLFPNFWKYARKYCNAKRGRYGWDFTGSRNEMKLHKKLTGSIMLRRLKKDVLHELPSKQKSFIPLDIDNRKEYESAERNFIKWIIENRGGKAAIKARGAKALVKINTLKQVAVKGKMKSAIKFIEDILNTGDKLVVFCVHRATINELMEKFGGIAVKVDGSVSGKTRQDAVDQFQNNPKVKLFVGNIRAAGEGITLTAASKVLHLELGWTPAEHDQAGDRVHRITQKNAVNEYYCLARGTIEEKIADLIDQKRKSVDMVTDGVETEKTKLITELMNRYEEKLKGDENIKN
ncbi:MAG: DEAD/DEAH box helicase [Candidatus Woesearchaeota archaeon]